MSVCRSLFSDIFRWGATLALLASTLLPLSSSSSGKTSRPLLWTWRRDVTLDVAVEEDDDDDLKMWTLTIFNRRNGDIKSKVVCASAFYYDNLSSSPADIKIFCFHLLFKHGPINLQGLHHFLKREV